MPASVWYGTERFKIYIKDGDNGREINSSELATSTNYVLTTTTGTHGGMKLNKCTTFDVADETQIELIMFSSLFQDTSANWTGDSTNGIGHTVDPAGTVGTDNQPLSGYPLTDSNSAPTTSNFCSKYNNFIRLIWPGKSEPTARDGFKLKNCDSNVIYLGKPKDGDPASILPEENIWDGLAFVSNPDFEVWHHSHPLNTEYNTPSTGYRSPFRWYRIQNDLPINGSSVPWGDINGPPKSENYFYSDPEKNFLTLEYESEGYREIQCLVGKNNMGWNVLVCDKHFGMGDQGNVYFPNDADFSGNSAYWTKDNTKFVAVKDSTRFQTINIKKEGKTGWTMISSGINTPHESSTSSTKITEGPVVRTETNINHFGDAARSGMHTKLLDPFNIVSAVYYYDGTQYQKLPEATGTEGDWNGPSDKDGEYNHPGTTAQTPTGKRCKVWNILEDLIGFGSAIWVKCEKDITHFEATIGANFTQDGGLYKDFNNNPPEIDGEPKGPFIFFVTSPL